MPAFSIRSHSDVRRVLSVEIRRISPSPHQPRRSFDPAELESLAASIQKFGLLSPLLVRSIGDGCFELIAGERRLRALEQLGRSHADVLIADARELDCALMALIENLQREELHFLDEAAACRRILREHGLSQEELAASLNRSPSALANLLRLLRLDARTSACIRESALSERHARALLRLSEPRDQLQFARQAAREGLSVRRLEEVISHHLRQAKPSPHRLPDGVIRDNRLVINALKDTVRQLKRIGVPASSRVEPHEDHYDVIVTIRTPRTGEENPEGFQRPCPEHDPML